MVKVVVASSTGSLLLSESIDSHLEASDKLKIRCFRLKIIKTITTTSRSKRGIPAPKQIVNMSDVEEASK